MNHITIILQALRRESALPDPVPWKLAGIFAMVLVGLLDLYYQISVTMDQIVTLVGVVFAIYTQIATTEKLGIPPRRKTERE